MKENAPNWTRKELKAYILIYCAHADFMENKYEKESILSMIDKSLYEKMHLEFDSDSVTEQIIKIKHHFDALEYSKKQLDNLREDVLELFLSDGKHEALEENMLHLMNHLLRK